MDYLSTDSPSSDVLSPSGDISLPSKAELKVSKHRPSYFTPKIKFSPQEDMILLQAVTSFGTSDWHVIATALPGRNARQCRERWNNYVNPALSNSIWTPEEDHFLLAKYQEIGPRWQTIASFFGVRSTNSVKNRYITLQRRLSKKQKKSKSKKPTKLHSKKSPKKPQQNQKPLKCSNSASSTGLYEDTHTFELTEQSNLPDVFEKGSTTEHQIQSITDSFSFLDPFQDIDGTFWENAFPEFDEDWNQIYGF